MDMLFTQVSGYVGSIAAGDEAIILSAGMGVRVGASSTTMPAPPTSLEATARDHYSEVDLTWDPVLNAVSYVIETSPRSNDADYLDQQDRVDEVEHHDQRLDFRLALLVPRRRRQPRRLKRLERPRNQIHFTC